MLKFPVSIKMRFRNILVRATNWVGDAVMSVPALQALREQFPEARISILARPWVASLYGREPFCDELLSYDAPRGWRGVSRKWSVASDLRRRKFDCAILFQNAFDAAALVRAAGVPTRIGYSRDVRAWLLTHPVPVPRAGETPRHQRFYYLELLKRAGLIDGYPLEKPIRLAGAEAAAQEGRSEFQKRGFPGRMIGVSPGAAYGGAKRWLPERFAEAAVRLGREHGAGIAIFGSKEEEPIAEIVREAIGAAGVACLNLAGRTTLAEFIGMVAVCDLFLTNDSGPMHIASALGVPTVAIFGATDEEATGPTGQSSRVVRVQVECSPCLLRECPIDHRCMARVSAEQVAEAALSLVEIENWTHETKSSR
ncbi:MAG TPA: lipopolysaccharide heptosyltransferase II [Bryobacteraceae bacterium]|jgi:heptosyltransferase-2